MDVAILNLLSDLGLKPAEVFILGLLWQNMKNINHLMDKMVKKVNELEVKINHI